MLMIHTTTNDSRFQLFDCGVLTSGQLLPCPKEAIADDSRFQLFDCGVLTSGQLLPCPKETIADDSRFQLFDCGVLTSCQLLLCPKEAIDDPLPKYLLYWFIDLLCMTKSSKKTVSDPTCRVSFRGGGGGGGKEGAPLGTFLPPPSPWNLFAPPPWKLYD